MVEITINMKQAIALIWTLIAIVLSLIIVLGMGFPYMGVSSYAPWWLLVAAFFGVLLVITLPVYLLIALWGILGKPEAE
jgi:hypothetical protein